MGIRDKKLDNEPNKVVTDFIEGLAENYPGLQYLDGFPQVKVVLRADVCAKSNDKVAVISDVVTEFIEGLVEVYPGLQNLDGFREVKVVMSNEKVVSISEIVTDFIKGLVENYPGIGLHYLDGFPQVKVVLRVDVCAKSNDKVAVISGGSSGHKPAHAGFVGKGMLTAAICGDVLGSPPVDCILAGIRAVTGPPGCLLIVKNYTGDYLNFGLAAEQAKCEGYKVEVLIVGKDCALPPPIGTVRRSLDGTIRVHKKDGTKSAAKWTTKNSFKGKKASALIAAEYEVEDLEVDDLGVEDLEVEDYELFEYVPGPITLADFVEPFYMLHD